MADFIPDAAAELAGKAGRRDDVPHDFVIHGPPDSGPVEIDQMESRRALSRKTASHFHRIAEDGLLVIVPLAQAHALAAAEIDRRKDFHVQLVPRRLSEQLTSQGRKILEQPQAQALAFFRMKLGREQVVLGDR